MENSQGSSLGYLLYDPSLLGYDRSFFKTISGTPDVLGGKILLNGASCGSLFSVIHGVMRMALTVPTAPTAGDNRKFGFISPNKANKDSAYFLIADDEFSAVTYDKDGTVETTAITWLSAWTNAEAIYEIRADKNRTVFLINGIQVADHYTSVPRKTMLPVYLLNGNTDNLSLSYLEIRDARDLLFFKGQAGGATEGGNVLVEDSSCNMQVIDLSGNDPTIITAADAKLVGVYVSAAMSAHTVSITDASGKELLLPASTAAGTNLDFFSALFEGGITITPNASSTGTIAVFWKGSGTAETDISPSSSVSSSVSPSLSPSSSNSPSLSPSSSISPSVSDSLSPSSSISPSNSPSLSPSSSNSPSLSPSTSISPSLSPSSSESPSNSPSLSPSASLSPSTSISPSVSPST